MGPVECGVLSVEFGPRTVDCKLWSMKYGLWTEGCRLWTVLWTVDFGIVDTGAWRTECGLW
eukprot:6999959-Karenia_brevis.AAC.1